MTLQELFNRVGEQPSLVIFYFAALPLAAFLNGLLAGEDDQFTPWNYIYSALIYLACVPGIFSITLNIYYFLFERRSILQTDVFVQILPVLSMILTVWIIRRNVDLDYVPGFDRISGLIVMITATLGLMWLADRTHIIAITFLRIEYVILIFFALLLMIRYGSAKLFGTPYRSRV